ncbi:YbfB/YjiJ family MFS transporter [uncultured Ornithinimicrobium sp.]|uniref:YbfB/YjiJ family MFS transporter n=1 Tax=uncultured Ornithinimicrobium sp. TaxID=259307 RepID=UPI002595FD79|nr:YbfB/YjiJ family MFS transporter [uncultured Ornithinimicrobium sp.]
MTSRADRLLVALALSSGPLVSLGLARFAYALLLPEMSAELGWTWSQAGALNTANAAGYLAGALVAAPTARALGTGRAFLLGSAVCTAALLLTALTGTYGVLLLARAAAGAGGAWAFVLGAALVAAAGAEGTPRRAALMLGLYYGGAGGGMTLAGLLVPWVLDRAPGSAVDVPGAGGLVGWQLGWVALAALGALATVVAAGALRSTADPAPPSAEHRRWDRGRIGWLSGGYTFFGLGYIAYLTFVVAFLQEQGVGLATVAAFWVVVGLAASAGWFAWGPLIGRLGGSRAMTVLMTVLALGTVLPVVVAQTWAFFVSGVVVGGTFLSVVTAMTVGVRRVLPAGLWTSGLAFATAAFGAGQTVGPWLTGWFSDRLDSLGAGLVLSAALLVAGALLVLPQREPGTARGGPASDP